MSALFQCLLVLLLATTGAWAEEAQLTLRSTVSGNQEQPRVMYIVPWQQPAATRFDYELQSTITQELFSQTDRYEFSRAMALRAQRGEQVINKDLVNNNRAQAHSAN